MTPFPYPRRYDVIVVGAGHAGCEAALAAARMGCETLLLTLNLDTIAHMPCNCSIGGPAKGHLAREVDALGGEMGRNTDRTLTHIRFVGTGKRVFQVMKPGNQSCRQGGCPLILCEKLAKGVIQDFPINQMSQLVKFVFWI